MRQRENEVKGTGTGILLPVPQMKLNKKTIAQLVFHVCFISKLRSQEGKRTESDNLI
jgi:hypothetical protein